MHVIFREDELVLSNRIIPRRASPGHILSPLNELVFEFVWRQASVLDLQCIDGYLVLPSDLDEDMDVVELIFAISVPIRCEAKTMYLVTAIFTILSLIAKHDRGNTTFFDLPFHWVIVKLAWLERHYLYHIVIGSKELVVVERKVLEALILKKVPHKSHTVLLRKIVDLEDARVLVWLSGLENEVFEANSPLVHQRLKTDLEDLAALLIPDLEEDSRTIVKLLCLRVNFDLHWRKLHLLVVGTG